MNWKDLITGDGYYIGRIVYNYRRKYEIMEVRDKDILVKSCDNGEVLERFHPKTTFALYEIYDTGEDEQNHRARR